MRLGTVRRALEPPSLSFAGEVRQVPVLRCFRDRAARDQRPEPKPSMVPLPRRQPDPEENFSDLDRLARTAACAISPAGSAPARGTAGIPPPGPPAPFSPPAVGRCGA